MAQIPEDLPDLSGPQDLAAEGNILIRQAMELVRTEVEDRTWQAFWRLAVQGEDAAAVAADRGMSVRAASRPSTACGGESGRNWQIERNNATKIAVERRVVFVADQFLSKIRSRPMRPSNCPDREYLLAYHDGSLPEAAAAAVIDHLRRMHRLSNLTSEDGRCRRCPFGQAALPARERPLPGGVSMPAGRPAQGRLPPRPSQGWTRAAAIAAIAGQTAGVRRGRADQFDPYHQWLGIPPEEQPPNHYRLLGLKLFESSPAVIENASDRQMAHLRTFQTGNRAALSQRLLNDVAAAKLCLLKAEKKAAYDEQLRRTLVAAAPPVPPAVPLPPTPPPGPHGDIARTLEFQPARHATAEPPGLPPPPDPMLLRQLGEYKLLQKLGEGGMGAVYKARHTKLNRDVALKILPKSREGDAEAIARFEREMQASGALNHPNIVATHDAREINGMRFLVMELLDGLDLEQVVRRGQPLSVAEACELVRQAALGLQHAYEHGLVHRDIKPSNLMLTVLPSPPGKGSGGEGLVKILDLGLAKAANRRAESG